MSMLSGVSFSFEVLSLSLGAHAKRCLVLFLSSLAIAWGMKAVITDWITPPDRDLVPRLSWKHRFDQGSQHEATGALLCPAGVDWNDSG